MLCYAILYYAIPYYATLRYVNKLASLCRCMDWTHTHTHALAYTCTVRAHPGAMTTFGSLPQTSPLPVMSPPRVWGSWARR